MTAGIKKWRWNKRTVIIAATAVVAVLVFGGLRLASSKTNIPTGEVKRKEFVDYLEIKGELKAERSVIVTAPFGAGDLQILTIVANSTKAKKGDVLVEFDATTVKSKLAQDKSALTSAEAEIHQARAAAKLKEEQDLTDVMKAKFDTERARMDASKQEILSVIEGEQAKLKLADAEQKQKEAEAKLKADRASAASDMISKKQKYDQAAYQVQLDEKSLALLTLRAPLDGVVALQNHWEPQTGATPFKQGDRAWPGAGLLELPDATALKISARIEEAERGQLSVGQSAKLLFDALPDKSFEGKVKTISPTASLDFTAGWPIPRNFSVELSLSELDPRMTPGMGAQVRVAVARVPDGIVIPARALFRKAGRTVVYAKQGSKYREMDVEVSRKSGDEVLIAKGLQAGTTLALKDPTLEQ